MPDDVAAGRAASRHRLVQRRKALGLTQEALADLLGVERSTVVRWERGETDPQPWIRPRLARALRLSPERAQVLLSGPGPASPDRTPPTVPRQLPAVVADFTGRAAELETLTGILDSARAGAPGTVVISAIGGTAGVGKTQLALHWAHQVAGRFPDGQLHVNLRGFDPSGAPVPAADAIRGFLDALGVPPERIPPSPDAQAGMYRGLLSGRRMLIVLDNARDEQQVRPLLPASRGSLVLITSRNQLSGLAAADGARLLRLDVLPHGEAVTMLAARLGADRAVRESAAIDEIAALCAHLPLALSVVAARAAARPGFPLAALAADLRDGARRLDALDAGDPAASVRAVFSWSQKQLSGEAARMFRLLGLHPGPDISVPAAASLAGTTRPEARRLLGELTRACLITEHVPGRHAFHDLLRAYAASQARDTENEAGRRAAIGRFLDHYLHTAGVAGLLLSPSHEPVVLPAPAPGAIPERPADHRQALAWFTAEREVLFALSAFAAESGFDRHAWQLPWAMVPYQMRLGRWHEWITIQRTALAAAQRLGDITGQAVSSRILANAYLRLADYDQALGHLTNSLELYRRLGNRLGEAKVHQHLGVLAEIRNRYAEAIVHTEKALLLFRAAGHVQGEIGTLNNIGWLHARLGDYHSARACCRQALAVSGETGYRRQEGSIWDTLGYAEHHLGNFPEAVACYERALSEWREFGDRLSAAETSARLGDTHRATGDSPRARDAWQCALAILEELQHPSADEVRAKLASLDGHPSAQHQEL